MIRIRVERDNMKLVQVAESGDLPNSGRVFVNDSQVLYAEIRKNAAGNKWRVVFHLAGDVEVNGRVFDDERALEKWLYKAFDLVRY